MTPPPMGMYPVEWSMTTAGMPRRFAARAAQTLSTYMRVCTTHRSMDWAKIRRSSAANRRPGFNTGNRPFITGHTGRR